MTHSTRPASTISVVPPPRAPDGSVSRSATFFREKLKSARRPARFPPQRHTQQTCRISTKEGEAADEEVHRLRQDLELTRNELSDINREHRTAHERLQTAETSAKEAVKDAESARMGSVADRCAKSDAEEAAALLTARLEASERRAETMEAARDDVMRQRDEALERVEADAEEHRKELDAARVAAAKAARECQKLTVALDEVRRSAADAQAKVTSLEEQLETAEADYAFAEKLTEDAVKELETDRARFELEGEKMKRREKEFMREAEQAASQRWERETQDEVNALRTQVTSLRAAKERLEGLLAAAAAESAARIAAAEEKVGAAELIAAAATASAVVLLLIALGMTATIFFYVAINLMMVMGLAPVVGIPLPFMSHGGSSMLTNMICIGSLMLVHRWNRKAPRTGLLR